MLGGLGVDVGAWSRRSRDSEARGHRGSCPCLGDAQLVVSSALMCGNDGDIQDWSFGRGKVLVKKDLYETLAEGLIALLAHAAQPPACVYVQALCLD